MQSDASADTDAVVFISKAFRDQISYGWVLSLVDNNVRFDSN